MKNECSSEAKAGLKEEFTSQKATKKGKIITKKKYGYIDKSGALIIEPKFDYADDFDDGVAQAGIAVYVRKSDGKRQSKL